MAMSWLWLGMVAVSVLFGAAHGTLDEVSAAAAEGAQQGVELCLAMAGVLCLWTGVMAVLREAGVLDALRRALRPVLGRLFSAFRSDREVMESLSANVAANLLGLGNAATPMGIRAAQRMARRTPGVASDALCMLVVCNTASIQLLPTTVAAARTAAGCRTPFDILPAVWLASACSVTAGIAAAHLLARLWGER